MMLGVLFAGGGLLSGGGLMQLGMLGLSTALGMMMNNHKTKPPIQDLKVSSSTYGKAIPRVWGTMRVTGNLIWATDLVQEARQVGKKGGGGKGKGSQTVYVYHANYAMSLCDGPITDVLRIWADSNLIYSKSGTGYTDSHGVYHKLESPGFTVYDDLNGKSRKQAGKSGEGEGFDGTFLPRFYFGDENQMPDSFMVEKNGNNATPAFRGLAYLMWEYFPLKDFGNRIPTITAEVISRTITTTVVVQTLYNVFTVLQPTDAAFLCNEWSSPCAQAWYDPGRNRIYQIGRAANLANLPNDIQPSESIIRVWDCQTYREVKQWRLADINPLEAVQSYDFATAAKAGGATTTTFDYTGANMPVVDAIIGLSSSGKLVGRDTIGNQSRLYFINPNTMTVDHAFGSKGPQFGAGPGLVGCPQGYGYGGSVGGDTDMVCWNISNDVVAFYGSSDLPVGDGYWFVNTGIGYSDSILGVVPGLGEGNVIAISNAGGVSLHQVTITGEVSAEQALALNPTVWTVDKQPDNYGFLAVPAFRLLSLDLVAFQVGRLGGKSQGAYIYALDMDMKVVWSEKYSDNAFDIPIVESGLMAQPVAVTGSTVQFFGNISKQLFEVDFSAKTVTQKPEVSTAPVCTGGQGYLSNVPGLLYLTNDAAQNYASTWVLMKTDKASAVSVSPIDVIRDLAIDVGLPSTSIDETRFTPFDLNGFLIENRTTARSLIEDLAKVYFFDLVESDGLVKVISRNQPTTVYTDQSVLGVITDGAEKGAQEWFKETKVAEIELPSRLSLSFIDPNEEYQTGTQAFARPTSPVPVLQSRESLDVNLPIALDNTTAKQMAQIALMAIWAERATHDIVLPWQFLKYDPADVFTITMDNGYQLNDRLTKMEIGADYSLACTLTSQFGAAYSSNAVGGTRGSPLTTANLPQPVAQAVALDAPLLQDSDDPGYNTPTFYYSAAAYDAGWRVGAMQENASDGSYTNLDNVTTDLVWGTTLGKLPDPPNGPFATDDRTKLVLAPDHDFSKFYEWESITDANWPSFKNALWIEGEIVYFKNVTPNADGTVTVDTLIRAGRGTEDKAYGHTAGAIFYVLDEDRLKVWDYPLSDIEKVLSFRLLTTNTLQAVVPNTPVTAKGRSLRPYAPTYIRRFDAKQAYGGSLTTPDLSAGDIMVSWSRRTRFGGPLLNATDVVPLNEQAESYEAFILAAKFDPKTFSTTNSATYRRRFAGLTYSALDYTVAMQQQDGFNAATDTLHVVVFQLSTTVGYGLPGAADLEPIRLL